MTKGVETKNIWDIAKRVGLDPVACSCGKRLDGVDALQEFFHKIIEICRDGGEVRIKNFGVFSAKMVKGRKVKSSALKGGEADFDDVLSLRFRQTKKCKEEINMKKEEKDAAQKDNS